MVSKTLLTGLALCAGTILAAPAPGASATDSPIPGYTISDFEWEVETTPGGPTILVNGTVQDVVARLVERARRGPVPWAKWYVAGQVFYKDKWNVIVREDTC